MIDEQSNSPHVINTLLMAIHLSSVVHPDEGGATYRDDRPVM